MQPTSAATPPQKAFEISHASEISAARRHGAHLAELTGLDEIDAGRLAIVVTETGTNILKHARQGRLILRAVWINWRHGVEVIAIDTGPGIANLVRSMHDGVSTTGTAGTGLGAMRRQSDSFDIFSVPGQGTGIHLTVLAAHAAGAHAAPDGMAEPGAWGSAPSAASATLPAPLSPAVSRLRVGAVCLPVAGEDLCGDAWSMVEDHVGLRLMVADGLGHGPGAALASQAAVAVLQAQETLEPAAMIEAMHAALQTTRGAAAVAARLDFQQDRIQMAGVGNISACVIQGETRRQLISHNGIVGHNLRKVQEFGAEWTPGALAIFCSDGIGTQWDLRAYPGLQNCHPALIAAVLYRDFMRLRDDATVLVIQRLN